MKNHYARYTCMLAPLIFPWLRSAPHFFHSRIATAATQQLISSSDDNNKSTALWADHQWNAEWLDNTTRLRTFISDIGTHPPEMALPIKRGTRLTASAPMSDVSAPAYTNGLWPLLRPVSESQKNKPPTMLSYNVQSTDLHMDCTIW